jgi:hypothetical protein
MIFGFSAIVAPTYPISADSFYLPVCPNRYSPQIIRSYGMFISKVSQTFIAADDPAQGGLTQLSVSVFNTNPMNIQYLSFASDLGSSSSRVNVAHQFGITVSQIGSQQPLDSASIGRVLLHNYRRAIFIDHLPYMTTVAAVTNPYDGLVNATIRPPGQTNAFLEEYAANKVRMHKMSNLECMRTSLVPYYRNLINLNTRALHVGQAAAIVAIALKGVSSAPYAKSQSGNLSVFNSPTGLSDALALSTDVKNGMGNRSFQTNKIPILTHLLKAGNEFFDLIF